MKNFTKFYIMSIISLLIIVFLWFACSQLPTNPEVTTLRPSFQVVDQLEFPFGPLEKVKLPIGNTIATLPGEITSAHILVLDVTKWNSWDKFLEDWHDSTKALDYSPNLDNEELSWTTFVNWFKASAGVAFSVYGDFSLKIDAEKQLARGSLRVNKGLNLLFVGLEQGDQLSHLGLGHVFASDKQSQEVIIEVCSVGRLLDVPIRIEIFGPEKPGNALLLDRNNPAQFQVVAFFDKQEEANVTQLSIYQIDPPEAGIIQSNGIFIPNKEFSGQNAFIIARYRSKTARLGFVFKN
ncbi:hypothetical protein JW964_12275 [candidate division KSB1 bacterium]|nr:hypothetical protein [candidate division KSB1 bacterium]